MRNKEYIVTCEYHSSIYTLRVYSAFKIDQEQMGHLMQDVVDLNSIEEGETIGLTADLPDFEDCIDKKEELNADTRPIIECLKIIPKPDLDNTVCLLESKLDKKKTKEPQHPNKKFFDRILAIINENYISFGEGEGNFKAWYATRLKSLALGKNVSYLRFPDPCRWKKEFCKDVANTSTDQLFGKDSYFKYYIDFKNYGW